MGVRKEYKIRGVVQLIQRSGETEYDNLLLCRLSLFLLVLLRLVLFSGQAAYQAVELQAEQCCRYG